MRSSLSYKAQRGAALLVALIMLIMVSLLAAAGFLITTTEARGAAGWSDRQRAIFLAESALREADTAVGQLVQSGSANINAAVLAKGRGYFIRGTSSIPAMNPWSEGSAITASVVDAKAQAASYMVVYEGMGAISETGFVNGSAAQPKKPHFTIYAKSGGVREGTLVVLSMSKEY